MFFFKKKEMVLKKKKDRRNGVLYVKNLKWMLFNLLVLKLFFFYLFLSNMAATWDHLSYNQSSLAHVESESYLESFYAMCITCIRQPLLHPIKPCQHGQHA
jgi:hypothetical protein